MKRILLLLFVLSFWDKNALYAQLGSYDFSQTLGTYTPINGTVLVDGTTLAVNNFYNSSIVTIPPFVYNGQAYDSLIISANGTMQFADIPTSPVGIINPFYTSLTKVYSSALSNIQYQTIGNETIVQWSGFKRANCTESFGFQVRLNHLSGSITFVYQLDMVPDAAVTNQPLVGLRLGTIFNNRKVDEVTGNWDASAAGESGASCRFTSNASNPRYFTTGQTYTWTPSACPYGYGTLAFGPATASTMTVNWQSANPGDYLLEYGPAGFTPGSGNVAGANGTVIDPAVMPLTIPGLTPNNSYDVYYRKNCTVSSNGYSNNSPKATFKQGYCTFSSVNPNYYIKDFSTTGATININNLNSGYSPTGYQDTTSAMILKQNSGDSVSFKLVYVGGPNTNIYGIWVDWNNDFVFSSSEQVYSGNGSSFLIPSSTPAGNYRMRVAYTYYVFFAYACGNFTGVAQGQPGGEAEDYILQVTNSSCKRPVAIVPGFPTDSGITLSWNNNGVTPSNNYDIYYSTDSIYPTSNTVPTLTNQVSGVQITGLAPATTYYVWVRANCGSEQSTWGWRTKMTTLCTSVSDYFENFGSGTVTPPCFSGYVTGGRLNVGTTPALLRPVNNASANTHWLRFKMNSNFAGAVLQVGYLTNPSDPSTFTLIQPVTSLSNTYLLEYTVDPGTLPAVAVLAFKSTNGVAIDSLYWEPKPICLPPVNGILSNPSDVTVQVSWTNPISMPSGNFDIYYSTSSTAPTNATLPTLTNQTSPLTISGLSPATTYYFWVRSSCGGGSFSNWVNGGNTKTLCALQSSFSENFDSVIPPPQGSPRLPDCFSSGTGTVTPAASYSAPYAAPLGNGDVLALRPVNNAGANTHWLRCRVKANASAYGDSIVGGYLTDPQNTASFVPLQRWFVNSTTTFDEYFFDFGALPGNNYVLALRVRGPATTSAIIYVDDVVWEPKPACIFVANVTAGIPTQTTDTIKWTPIASQSPASNYDIYYSTDPTPPTATSIPNLTNQVPGAVLTGLDMGTTYYAWVRSNCGTSQTVWTGPAIFNTVPANDNATGAISLTPGAGCSGAMYTNVSATTIANEPFPACAGFKVAPVWFKFIAPSGGAVRVYSTSGTADNSKVGLFSATDSSDYSTFSIISCNGEGGNAAGTLSNGNGASIVYATGLTPGVTYYLAYDAATSTSLRGTFCIQVEELNGNMLSATNTCSSAYQTNVSGANYSGWASLLDNDGNILALVRQPTGGGPSNFRGKQNVHTGTIRTYSNGSSYLDRNWQISYTSAVSTNVQLFFSDAEFQALKTADPSINTLNDLLILKVPNNVTTACLNDYNGQVNTILTPTGNGTSADGLVHWLNFTTPDFSNFFISGANTPLAVQLVDFKGSKSQAGNLLSWNFACDAGEQLDVVLERNEDGKSQYQSIQKSVADDANCGKYMTYLDKDLSAGAHFYRLRYAAQDGKAKYSKVIALTGDSKAFELISVVPNPVHNSAVINLLSGSESKGTIRITDVAGRVVYHKAIALVNGNNSIELNTASFAPGFYMITVADEAGNKRALKLVKE